jgi:hypothetical protein
MPGVAAGAAAAALTETFDEGIDEVRYSVATAGDLYAVGGVAGALRISKPAGGAEPCDEFKLGGITSTFVLSGDFAVTVAFRLVDFPLPDLAGGRNESTLRVEITGERGASVFAVLRFAHRTLGQMLEVWAQRPGGGRLLGQTESNLTSGQYRVTRTGTTMEAFIRGDESEPFTLVASETDASYAGEATISLLAIQGGELPGTASITPLAIEFDDLLVESDEVGMPGEETTTAGPGGDEPATTSTTVPVTVPSSTAVVTSTSAATEDGDGGGGQSAAVVVGIGAGAGVVAAPLVAWLLLRRRGTGAG